MPVEKRAFLTGHVCPTKGWSEFHAPEEAPLPGLEWLFYSGADTGRRARGWLGEGLALPRAPREAALQATNEAVDQGEHGLLFEASFAWGELSVRADALRRSPSGWAVIEVKSGLSSKPKYLDDLAYTVCVAGEAGLPVIGASLVLINRDYRLGGAAPMFVEMDVTAQAFERATAFRENAQDIALAISAGQRPEPSLIFACRDCDLFKTVCIGKGIPDPLFILPRLSGKKFMELRAYERLSRIPRTAKLTATQQRVVDLVQSGSERVDAAALRVLDEIVWPVHYLDFETVNPYLPWFDGSPPYEKVPFQYSLHIRQEPGAVLEHRHYLAAATGDWRRELAEQLLTDVGTKGSIVVYSSAEHTDLTKLVMLFPDLHEPLDSVAARLFDLERLFKEGYVHPAFEGKTSIKKVLPVVVPELSYDGLELSNGLDASGTFALMRVGEYPPETHDAHRDHLLAYCALDTNAMVQLHEALLRISGEA